MTGTIKIDVYNTDDHARKLIYTLHSVVVPRVGEQLALPDGKEYDVHGVTYHFNGSDWIRSNVTVDVSEDI